MTRSCTLAFAHRRTMEMFAPGAARPGDNHSVIIELRVDDVDAEPADRALHRQGRAGTDHHALGQSVSSVPRSRREPRQLLHARDSTGDQEARSALRLLFVRSPPRNRRVAQSRAAVIVTSEPGLCVTMAKHGLALRGFDADRLATHDTPRCLLSHHTRRAGWHPPRRGRRRTRARRRRHPHRPLLVASPRRTPAPGPALWQADPMRRSRRSRCRRPASRCVPPRSRRPPSRPRTAGESIAGRACPIRAPSRHHLRARGLRRYGPIRPSRSQRRRPRRSTACRLRSPRSRRSSLARHRASA